MKGCLGSSCADSVAEKRPGKSRDSCAVTTHSCDAVTVLSSAPRPRREASTSGHFAQCKLMAAWWTPVSHACSWLTNTSASPALYPVN